MTAPLSPLVGVCPEGLHYVEEVGPALSRQRVGRGFVYRWPDGRQVRDHDVLRRIRQLAIPPAWTDVWISGDPCGHLQAFGRDARRRKQYRYHPRFREERDATKFARLAVFGRALPRIRRRVDRDLARRGISKAKVVAAVVRLLDATSLRVGNPEYARQNGSFGLTTLRNRHVVVEGSRLRFRFRAKAGKVVQAGIRDRRLARIVARCQELPGQELFEYLDDDGQPRSIGSTDVNAYLREAAAADVTAKDFRTWSGTLLAYRALRAAEGRRASRRVVVESAQLVAEALGNTPAVSRRSYIAPSVIDAYLGGALDAWRQGTSSYRRARAGTRAEELELIHLLERQAGRGAPTPPSVATPAGG